MNIKKMYEELKKQQEKEMDPKGYPDPSPQAATDESFKKLKERFKKKEK